MEGLGVGRVLLSWNCSVSSDTKKDTRLSPTFRIDANASRVTVLAIKPLTVHLKALHLWIRDDIFSAILYPVSISGPILSSINTSVHILGTVSSLAVLGTIRPRLVLVVSRLLAFALSCTVHGLQISVEELVDVQPAAIWLLLRIQRSNNQPSRLFTASLSVLHLALI